LGIGRASAVKLTVNNAAAALRSNGVDIGSRMTLVSAR
jgi:hypothetical protein